jgi:uncharacterized membrane protein YheB (UPF0754 family)
MATVNFEMNGYKYNKTEKGYCYKSSKQGSDLMMRIPANIFEKAFDEYLQIKADEASADDWQTTVDAEREARAQKQAASDKQAEDTFNKTLNKMNKKQNKENVFTNISKEDVEKEMKRASKPRKSKDIAFTTTVTLEDGKIADVTLTAKQVDFIKHIPDTCFYEHGLESTMWVDVLADEISGQFAGKPMTVGAMISTLREKEVIYVAVDKVNGKKSKFFGFTDLGKLVAKELGLN